MRELEQENQIAPINVELVDHEVAEIFEKSPRAEVGLVVTVPDVRLCHPHPPPPHFPTPTPLIMTPKWSIHQHNFMNIETWSRRALDDCRVNFLYTILFRLSLENTQKF